MKQIVSRTNFTDWCLNSHRETLIMGIVNVTPDSFSDGGQFYQAESAIDHGLSLIKEGAEILDIGGESTRPGAESISKDEELNRILPVIKGLRKIDQEILISIDTTKSAVAAKAIEAGADIVNDISGLTLDKKMAKVVSKLDIPVVIMHLNGSPATMQKNPHYENLVGEISSFFLNRINVAKAAGIQSNKIILDPGIGFGKTMVHNFTLIQKLNKFCELGFPILIGPSRKAFIGTTLDLPTNERVEGTAAAVSAGILNGARIVRVHDVKEMKRVVTITEKIRTAA
ncbi:MAG: dihydropteroate synthase [Fidelibacterota bacterium]